jgi:hypothetical protein
MTSGELESTYATAEEILTRAIEVRRHLALARGELNELRALTDEVIQWPSLRELDPLIEGMDTRIERFRRTIALCRRMD